MAENSRIGSAPTTSFSARLSNAACGLLIWRRHELDVVSRKLTAS